MATFFLECFQLVITQQLQELEHSCVMQDPSRTVFGPGLSRTIANFSEIHCSLSLLFPNHSFVSDVRPTFYTKESLTLPLSHVLAIPPPPQSEDLGACFLEDFNQCNHSNLRDVDFLTLWVTLWRLPGRISFYLDLWVKTKQLTSIPQGFCHHIRASQIWEVRELRDLLSWPKTQSLSNSPQRYSGGIFSANALTQW